MTLLYSLSHYLTNIFSGSRTAHNRTNGLGSSFVQTLLLAIVVAVGGAVFEPLLGGQIQSG
jgi:hypothetical protein